MCLMIYAHSLIQGRVNEENKNFTVGYEVDFEELLQSIMVLFMLVCVAS